MCSDKSKVELNDRITGAIAVRGQRHAAAALALLFGAFLIIGAGFAQPNLLHNAAHDGRHAFAFPCH